MGLHSFPSPDGALGLRCPGVVSDRPACAVRRWRRRGVNLLGLEIQVTQLESFQCLLC